MYIQYLNFYRLHVLESPLDDPLFRCREDSSFELYPNMDEAGRVYLYCLSCPDRIYLGLKDLNRIKELVEQYQDESSNV